MTESPPLRLASLVLFGVTFCLFSPALAHEFINYDDGRYVTENELIRRGLTWEGLREAFMGSHFHMWHPLTTLSHMVDCELFGLSPGGHHLGNLLLHSGSATLLFRFLWQSSRAFWPALFAAGIFALHPLRVESVAWVAERKDALCTFFWLLTMQRYSQWVREPGRGKFFAFLASFVLGLLAKPMFVTLPFALLLLDCWPLGRLPLKTMPEFRANLSHLLREKLPLISFSLLLGIVTYSVQSAGDVVKTTDQFSLGQRFANALVSYARYLGKQFWPTDLAVFYPHPGDWGITTVISSGALLLAITLLAWLWRGNRPFVLTGWLWFLGTLIPVIGLVQVGIQSMADRYSYIPSIGVTTAFVWGCWTACNAASSEQQLRRFVSAGSLVLLLLGFATARQLSHWQSSVSLFTHTIAVTGPNYLAHKNLGAALGELGAIDAGLAEYEKSLAIQPNAPLHYELAFALRARGRTNDAIGHFHRALGIRPDFAEAHYQLSLTLADLNQMDEAVRHFDLAIRLKPELELRQPDRR